MDLIYQSCNASEVSCTIKRSIIVIGWICRCFDADCQNDDTRQIKPRHNEYFAVYFEWRIIRTALHASRRRVSKVCIIGTPPVIIMDKVYIRTLAKIW